MSLPRGAMDGSVIMACFVFWILPMSELYSPIKRPVRNRTLTAEKKIKSESFEQSFCYLFLIHGYTPRVSHGSEPKFSPPPPPSLITSP